MFKKIAILILLLSWGTPSFALNKADVERKLNVDIKTISPTPIKGILEVITEDKNIFYIDSTGKYLLIGNMVDADKRTNITGEKLAKIRMVDFKSLPLVNAIKTGRGDKKIAVFHDPDCPYCRQLHTELKKLKGVEIYNFIFDKPELHPNAYLKAKKIHCAKDPVKALDMAMGGNELTNFSDCATNKVDENRALANMLGIDGTPFMILENGSTIRGLRPVEVIEKAIDNK